MAPRNRWWAKLRSSSQIFCERKMVLNDLNGELPYLVREKISAHRDEDTGAIGHSPGVVLLSLQQASRRESL